VLTSRRYTPAGISTPPNLLPTLPKYLLIPLAFVTTSDHSTAVRYILLLAGPAVDHADPTAVPLDQNDVAGPSHLVE
ncbi:hypothetical protein S245_071614, partial [Arachis hypogaea]